MSRIEQLTPQQVEFIPDTIEDGILYISKEFEVSVHNCACGCGGKTVLPFKQVPNAPDSMHWGYTESDQGVSFDPSIGNWGYECQSHYYIKNNKIIWTP